MLGANEFRKCNVRCANIKPFIAPSIANIKVTDTSVLFEQLVSNDNRYFAEPTLAIQSPVLPIGLADDLFVSNSVRASQNVIAQNNAFGIFNVDTPTANELNNFTFDLKGLPQGMDTNLFVQNAVRGGALTFEPALFVQNSVRQSQLESTARNIGVASFNSATPSVPDLFSPFEIGSPMSFGETDIAPPTVELSPIKTTNVDKNNELKNLDKQKTNKECIPLRTVQRDYTKPYQLVKKPMADRLKPASSFTQQLTQAKRKTTNNVFCKH